MALVPQASMTQGFTLSWQLLNDKFLAVIDYLQNFHVNKDRLDSTFLRFKRVLPDLVNKEDDS